MSTTRVLWIAVLVSSAAGCGWRKQHLGRDFARSNDAVFAAQRVRKEAPPATAVAGLDSQEAAIISDHYRASLAPKGQKVGEEPVILVAPPSRERPQPLAPSVPKEK
jgi:hypothetical protein